MQVGKNRVSSPTRPNCISETEELCLDTAVVVELAGSGFGKRSYSMPGPIDTVMDLWAGKRYRCVTSHPGPLSLLPFVGR